MAIIALRAVKGGSGKSTKVRDAISKSLNASEWRNRDAIFRPDGCASDMATGFTRVNVLNDRRLEYVREIGSFGDHVRCEIRRDEVERRAVTTHRGPAVLKSGAFPIPCRFWIFLRGGMATAVIGEMVGNSTEQ